MSKLITQDIDLSGKINEFRGADIASAATTDISASAGNLSHITGVTTITSLGVATQAGVCRTVIFDGILTITHDVTKIKLPGNENIITADGDRAVFTADTTEIWVLFSYVRASGAIFATHSKLAGVRRKTIPIVTGTIARTLSGAAMATGSIQNLTGAGNLSLTLDTGTALSTAVPGVAVGDSVEFLISNSSSGLITILGAAGTVLANAMTVATLTSRVLIAVNTGANSWTIY